MSEEEAESTEEAAEVGEDAPKPKKKKKEKKEEVVKLSPQQQKKIDRQATQENVREAVNKEFGEGTSFKAVDQDYKYIPRISSGSFLMDYALGGGWPRGRIILCWGARSSSKTTSCKRAVADAQKRDIYSNRYLHTLSEEELEHAIPMSCAWVDIEGTFDFAWAEQIGINLSELEYAIPSSHEQAVDIVQAYVKSGAYDVIVVDSLAASSHESELGAAAADKDIGMAARLNNKMFRKVQSELNNIMKLERALTPTVFFVNQMRQSIGFGGGGKVKPGGNGQDFFSSVEVFFWSTAPDYFDETKKLPKTIGFGFKVEKNKVSPPKIQGEYRQSLGDHPKGQWKLGEVIESKEVMEFAKKLGMYHEIEDKSKKTWVLNGEEFSKKMDLNDKWVADRQKFGELKQMMLKKLFPKN